jgi:hypothetical protein
VHRLVEIAAGNVDVSGDVLDGTVGYDEAETARVRGDASDDEVHQIGNAVAVAAGLNERAGGHQVLEEALERGPLLAGYLQPLQQLSGCGGVGDFFANELEQLLLIQHLN